MQPVDEIVLVCAALCNMKNVLIQTKKAQKSIGDIFNIFDSIFMEATKKLLITLENFQKIHVKEFILVMLHVSSLQFYLKWTISRIFSKIVPRFTHFIEHLRLMISEYPD